MHTVRVTIRHDKASRLVLECGHVPNGLVEQTRQAHGEIGRAVTVHDQVRVSHVAHVVFRVKADAIPARREHELEANSIGAVRINVVLGWQEVAVQRALCSLGVVQAVETKCALGQVGLGDLVQGAPERLVRVGLLVVASADRIVAAIGVTGDHLEALGESLDVLAVQEVVPERRHQYPDHGLASTGQGKTGGLAQD